MARAISYVLKPRTVLTQLSIGVDLSTFRIGLDLSKPSNKHYFRFDSNYNTLKFLHSNISKSERNCQGNKSNISISTSRSININKRSLIQKNLNLEEYESSVKLVRNRKVKMTSTVQVKSCEEDDRLLISIELLRGSAVKSFNLNRVKSESLGSALQRLQMNLSKKLIKKSKKKNKAKNSKKTTSTKSEECLVDKDEQDLASNKKACDEEDNESTQEIPVHVIHNGNIVDLSVINENAWIEGAFLKIENEEIPICFNPPSVKLNNLSEVIMEGFPLYPNPEFEFVQEEKCEFFWKTFSQKDLINMKRLVAKRTPDIDLSGSISAYSYTPVSDDVGKYLLLACLPVNNDKQGRLEVVLSKAPITEGPGLCPFQRRHEFTQLLTEFGV